MPQAAGASSSLPPAVRVRLYELFVQIEREFEVLYAENLALQERLERAERRHQQHQQHQHHLGAAASSSYQSSFHAERSLFAHSLSNPEGSGGAGGGDGADAASLALSTPSSAPPHSVASTPAGTGAGTPQASSSSGVGKFQSSLGGKGLYAHKLRSHTNRLRAQTNRFMSNLKGQALNCSPIRRYSGHKDGIWEVSVSRMGLPILGTASADHTGMIWGMHSGQALLQYSGHTGSVNSLRFHPNKELVRNVKPVMKFKTQFFFHPRC